MLAPFRQRSFRFQWPADLATSFAFEMENLALGWFILVETESVALLGLFASLQFLGTLLAPALGLASDRLGHRDMLGAMRACYLLLAAALLALIAAGELGAWHAFLLAGLAGLMRPSDIGLRNVLIGATVPPERLMGAMGLSRLTADMARLFGALAGAGLVVWLGMAAVYVAVVLLYAVGALFTFGIERAPPAAPRASQGGMGEALREVWNTPPQLAAMSFAFLVNLTAFPFLLGLLPYLAKEVYGLDQAGLGWLMASAAAGCIAASLLLSRLQGAVRPGRFVVGFALAWQMATAALGLSGEAAVGLTLLFLIGLLQGLCIVPMAVMQLRNAPPELRGRIMGLRTLAVYGLPIGLWIAGPLIERIGFGPTAMLYGGLGGMVTLALLLRWRRHLWPAEAPANAHR